MLVGLPGKWRPVWWLFLVLVCAWALGAAWCAFQKPEHFQAEVGMVRAAVVSKQTL
jgi:hypothetical protein